MFEIGSTLHEARERRGVTLADAEAATRIRARHLVALEDERFAELPGEAYARSFLREYGEFLGLDGQRLTTEYDLRFATPAPQYVEPVSFRRRRWPGRRWLIVLFAFVAAGVIAAAVVVPGGTRRAVRHPTVTTHHGPSRPVHQPTPARPHPALPHLQLVAARGDCWLEIHAGSRRGPVLYEKILHQGSSLAFVRRFLWIRIGAPTSLEIRLNGKPLALARSPSPLDVQFALRQLRVVA